MFASHMLNVPPPPDPGESFAHWQYRASLVMLDNLPWLYRWWHRKELAEQRTFIVHQINNEPKSE